MAEQPPLPPLVGRGCSPLAPPLGGALPAGLGGLGGLSAGVPIEGAQPQLQLAQAAALGEAGLQTLIKMTIFRARPKLEPLLKQRVGLEMKDLMPLLDCLGLDEKAFFSLMVHAAYILRTPITGQANKNDYGFHPF